MEKPVFVQIVNGNNNNTQINACNQNATLEQLKACADCSAPHLKFYEKLIDLITKNHLTK